MGKKHEPTAKDRRMVEALAACVPQEDVATVMGIDEKTLRLHYRPELDRALIIANSKVAGNLYKIACGTGREAVTAAIFWLKTRAGWSEYAPPPKSKEPKVPKQRPLGKKEQAALDAREMPEDQDWAELVGPERTH
jgi:hypothetical protein